MKKESGALFKKVLTIDQVPCVFEAHFFFLLVL